MIRVAVFGAGAWGINHVRVVAAESSCELACVVDPDPSALARVRGIHKTVPVSADPDQALADPAVDAVIIASPAATHRALTSAALAAGKHVLVEKPLTLSLAEACALAQEAVASRRVAMVGHLMVYHPAVVRIGELLRSGALGRLHYLHSTRVNLGRLRRDENALWSFGPHDISMIDYLTGRQPASVTARGACVLQPGVEDVVFLTMRYATGEMAHVHLSWLSPHKERRLTLVCSQKMVELDDVAPEKVKIYDRGYDRVPEFTHYSEYLTLRDGDVFIPQIAMDEPLRLQLREFMTSITERRTPVTDLNSAVRVVAVLEAAQRSLALDGMPVPIESPAD